MERDTTWEPSGSPDPLSQLKYSERERANSVLPCQQMSKESAQSFSLKFLTALIK